jgi:regulator of protease activity HflC (stomatin/prohibitin superfamily)
VQEDQDTIYSPKRAERIAFAALFLTVVFFLGTYITGEIINAYSVRVEASHILGGCGIWLLLALQFRQKRMAQEEKIDAQHYERLRKEGRSTSVFENEMTDGLYLNERRLAWMEKYLVPVCGITTATYLVIMGLLQLSVLNRTEFFVLSGSRSTVIGIACMLTVFALLSFLLSRFSTGMSRVEAWRPLRAGGAYLLSNALACFVLAIVLILDENKFKNLEKITSFVIVWVQIIIGAEMFINLVFDLFKPRIKGQYHRAAFESRILGLFSESGGLFNTAAHAVDYQFGFKVSDTWFYRLLEKAILPMLVVQAAILYLMSCIAVIEPGHVGVREHWGVPQNVDAPWTSGIHFKYPWPIDKVRTFEVDRLQRLEIGYKSKTDSYENYRRRGNAHDKSPLLWKVEHWAQEMPFIVAVADDNTGNDLDAHLYNDFDLLTIAVDVQYRIGDVAKYGYNEGDQGCYIKPKEIFEMICSRAMMQYAAQHDMESILGSGRYAAAEALQVIMSAKVDEYALGIHILSVMFQAVHPPIEIAESYEKVVGALQEKQTELLRALGEKQMIIASAKSEATVIVAKANAAAFTRRTQTEASAVHFADQVKAHRLGGDLYLKHERYKTLNEVLPNIRKYVVDSEKFGSWVYELDLKDKLQSDLFENLDVEALNTGK